VHCFSDIDAVVLKSTDPRLRTMPASTLVIQGQVSEDLSRRKLA